MTSFLFTIQNPILRVASAFDFNHIKNNNKNSAHVNKYRRVFSYHCFPTMEDLVTILSKKQKHEKYIDEEFKIVDCFTIGKETLEGFGNTLYNTHLSSNYAWYAKWSIYKYPEREVLALQTDHLWKDILHLNSLLGGNNDLLQGIIGHKFSHGSEFYKISSTLSQKGKEVICCYIRSENEVYKHLIQKAANLKPIEKKEALDELDNDCRIPESMRNETFSFINWRNDYC